MERFRIGFGGFPIIFAGILFGPWYGAVVGLLADIQGFFIHPSGPYLPHFTVTSGLTGLIPGLLVHSFFRGRRGYIELAVAIGTGQLITTVFLVPLVHNELYGIPLIPMILAVFPVQAVTVCIYVLLCKRLLRLKLFEFQ